MSKAKIFIKTLPIWVAALLVMFAVLVISAILILMCIWTDRSLDFWYSYTKGAVMNFPMWLSVIVTFVAGMLNKRVGFGVAIVGNVVTEVLRIML